MFAQADVSGADFFGANFTYGNLSGANASGAIFRGANLFGLECSEANLSDAAFTGATLLTTGFLNAKVDGNTKGLDDLSQTILSETIVRL